MDIEKEPNSQETKSLDSTIDSFLDGNQKAQGTSSPETTETEQTPGSVSDTPKTESPDVEAEKDKGFASHPAWVKREAKLKEALSELEAARNQAKSYDELLGDPVVYKRFLEKQGYSQEHINSLMAERGFQVERQNVPAAEKMSIATEVCKELGWNIDALNQQQKDYINDLINLNEKVSKKIFDRELGERLKPLETFVQQNQTNEKLRSDYENAKSQAKEEFPDLDWDKDIEPAMARYLDELDKKDPRNTIKISPVELYEKATRQILKEKRIAQERQAVRDEKKAVAKPLRPGAELTPDKTNKLKGRTVKETADKFLDARGIF